jgi:membrane-bound lytic murein transglycosylase B
VFQALATLAWDPRRAEYFRNELFDALTIVSRGHIDAASMTGSWAGAMGQPQFMPSSYLKFAEDFDRDGRRDIWRSTPDALASIARYLSEWGWDDEFTWGREVRLSAAVRERIARDTPMRTDGCFAMRNMTERLPLEEWREMGIRRADGGPLPQSDVKAGLMHTDTRSFLVYENYDAILRYNCAHYYALTVALLADQLR